jgi:hypothetical protein
MGGVYSSDVGWENGDKEKIKNDTNVKEITDTYKKVIGAEGLGDAKNDASDVTNSISTETTKYRYDKTLISKTGTDASGNIFSEGFDALGNLASYVFKSVSGQQLSLTGDGIGSVLGSSIGSAIGGNNFATKIITTTLIGSLGQTVGSIFTAHGTAGSLVAQVSNGKTGLDDALGQAANILSNKINVNILPNIYSGLSSLLVGELAGALHLNGFTAGLFTTPNAANDNAWISARKCG